jgi:diguanylate cyclase (GGDEF)-like protein
MDMPTDLRPARGAAVAPLVTARSKLRFLRENLGLLLFWPLVAIILSTLGWQLLFAKLEEDRQETERFAMREAATLASTYAEHLKRTLDTIDQIVLLAKLQWEDADTKFRLENFKSKGLFPGAAPFHLSIVDRNGIRRTSTFGASAIRSGPDVSDRSYFQAQRMAMIDGLYISEPIRGRSTGDAVIQISRRLLDARGEFDGVALLSVKTDFFTANYDDATLGPEGLLGMLGIDGEEKVTRAGAMIHPPGPKVLAATPRFSEIIGGGLLHGPDWFADKRSRYIGWQLVEGYPFVAITGLDQARMLAGYEATRAAQMKTATIATFALAVFALMATGFSLGLSWRKYQHELTRMTYRMATEGGNEGFFIARPVRDENGRIIDFVALDCNQRGAEFFRLRREDFIGRKASYLYDTATFAASMKMMEDAMRLGKIEGETVMAAGERGRKRYLHLKAVRSGDDLAVTLRDITREKQHVRELERRGNEDALTGLPNRLWAQSYLPQAIERAAAKHARLALLFVDLDGFKAVNDTLGHAAGDEVLRNAARRLKEAVRPHDTVVRLGGDEFLVIIEHIAEASAAAHVAERILHAFQEGFRLSQGSASVGTSIGISLYPDDAANMDALMKSADVAMYSAKLSGKRRYSFFDPQFYERMRARSAREAALRHAIAHDQFKMLYQPRVNVATGETSSLEALVRWAHGTDGLIEPLEFIPLAEETGLILHLGELIIDKVCAQIARWAKAEGPLVPVSINVSPRQFNEMDVGKVFRDSLARHGVDASLVEIELTETTMMGDTENVSNALQTIREMGIRLLVDDFGTGYSSLSQLQKLDFDVLKVDRAFTSQLGMNEQGRVLFKAIITMAHALDMRVVAEGVENEDQVSILRALDCDEIQGFYIAHPLAPTHRQRGLFQQLSMAGPCA